MSQHFIHWQAAGAPRRLRVAHIAAAAILLLVFPATLAAQSASNAESLQQAQSLAAANRLEEANRMLSEIVRQQPGNLPAWQQLGQIQLRQSLNDDAMQSFEEVLKSRPHLTEAQHGEVSAAIAAALADRNAGNDDRALGCLLRARKYVPSSPELLLDFGIQADSMKIYKDAEEALTKARTLDSHNPKILYALAHVQLDEQETADAELNLRAYLKMRPDDPTAHYGLGNLLYMMSKDEEARTELERSIALQPRQTESYYELGQIALDSHDEATANEEYAKVLAAAPNHGGALTGMGVLAYRAKDYATAANYLSKAVLYAPDYVTAHRYYAMTLARQGQQAQSSREQAIAQDLTERQNRLTHGYTLRSIP